MAKVVGIDFGNRNSVIATAQKGGIDILMNEVSNRQTPFMVAFQGNRRYIGESALGQYTLNVKGTISQLKRFIGRKFNEPDIQEELPFLPFKVREVEDGKIGFELLFNDEVICLSSEELTAMFLLHLKEISEKSLNTEVKDMVISIPVWYTQSQRRALLDAASVAGINTLRLFHETTAAALSYGIYKELSDNPINVMLLDMGDSALNVSIVAFSKGKLRVLGHAFDRSLGGRNFDRSLATHFAKIWKDKHRIDIWENAKAAQRVLVACERLKKVLSANPQAPISVESLMNDIDVSGMMTRQEFEELAKPLFDRIRVPIEQVLKDTGFTPDQIHSVEMIGGASRMPQVSDFLTQILGKVPQRTLNAEETVAKGCALQGAMLSPLYKVREFKVEDANPFPVNVEWKDAVGDSMEAESSEIFPTNLTFPCIRAITFPKVRPFEILAQYAPTAAIPVNSAPFIGKWNVMNVPPTEGKIKVKIKLNLHGLVVVDKAELIEVVKVEGDAQPMETDKKAGAEKKEEEKKEGEKAEEKPKTKTQTSPLVVNAETFGLAPSQIERMREDELRRVKQDKEVRETIERKNAVESYVYDTRSSLYNELSDYATEEDKEKFSKLLNDTETWLYEEGESQSRDVYIAKLTDLRKVGDPVFKRKKEFEERDDAVAALKGSLQSWRGFTSTTDPKFEHISAEDREKILNKCRDVEENIFPRIQHQSTLPKTADPVVFVSDIQHSKENLDKFCAPIMTKPKPAPPKEEKKEEKKEEPKAENKEEKKEENKSQDEAAGNKEEKKEESKPQDMDVDI